MSSSPFRSVFCAFSSHSCEQTFVASCQALVRCCDTQCGNEETKGEFAQRLLHSVSLPILEGKGFAGDVTGEQFSSEPCRVPGFKPSKSPPAFLIVSLSLRSAGRNLSHLLGKERLSTFYWAENLMKEILRKSSLCIKSKREAVV